MYFFVVRQLVPNMINSPRSANVSSFKAKMSPEFVLTGFTTSREDSGPFVDGTAPKGGLCIVILSRTLLRSTLKGPKAQPPTALRALFRLLHL